MNARECDCPPQVIRCAHIGDRRVALAAGSALPPFVHAQHPGISPFGVATRIGPPVGECDCGCGWAGWYNEGIGPLPYIYLGSDHNAALAAFHEAEQRLLAGAL